MCKETSYCRFVDGRMPPHCFWQCNDQIEKVLAYQNEWCEKNELTVSLFLSSLKGSNPASFNMVNSESCHIYSSCANPSSQLNFPHIYCISSNTLLKKKQKSDVWQTNKKQMKDTEIWHPNKTDLHEKTEDWSDEGSLEKECYLSQRFKKETAYSEQHLLSLAVSLCTVLTDWNARI